MRRFEDGGGEIFEKQYPWGKHALGRKCHGMERDFENPGDRAFFCAAMLMI